MFLGSLYLNNLGTAITFLPRFIESNIVPNLYFCGEILDVHGDCGGFNLQWAWSSGYAVAQSIAQKK